MTILELFRLPVEELRAKLQRHFCDEDTTPAGMRFKLAQLRLASHPNVHLCICLKVAGKWPALGRQVAFNVAG